MALELKRLYKDALDDLLRAREFAGGPLSQELEAKHVGLLDDIWHKLGTDEQEELERELGQKTA